MKTYTYLTIALVTILFISCKPKTEHTIVQGYVKTFGSDVTHAGIEIKLNEEGVGVTLLDETTSNADGWYQLEGEFDVDKTHYLDVVDAPNDHDEPSNAGYNSLQIKTGGVQHFDIKLNPFCYVNLYFKNMSPCDQNDVLTFRGKNGSLERVYGSVGDIYYLHRFWGNQEVIFSYGTNKCNVGQNYLDTIGFIPAFDTVQAEVFY